MRKRFLLATIAGLGTGILVSSCSHGIFKSDYEAGSVETAVAVLQPVSNAEGGPRGSAWLMHEARYLRIAVQLEGLKPDAYHGIQIDTLGGCEGRGPEQVYDPQGHYHAGPAALIRRVGNLGNVRTDADGKAEFHISIDNASLNGNHHAILGRSITVNEKLDNLTADPHGEMGQIVACGVIGVAPPEAKVEKVWLTEIEKSREELVPESLEWYVPEGGYPKAPEETKTEAPAAE